MDENDIENIPNTFAHRCDNQVFSVNSLVHLVMHGFIKKDDIPEDVRIRITNEIHKRYLHQTATQF